LRSPLAANPNTRFQSAPLGLHSPRDPLFIGQQPCEQSLHCSVRSPDIAPSRQPFVDGAQGAVLKNQLLQQAEDAKTEVIKLSLDYSLVSDFTSFLIVDDAASVESDDTEEATDVSISGDASTRFVSTGGGSTGGSGSSPKTESSLASSRTASDASMAWCERRVLITVFVTVFTSLDAR